MISLSTLVLNIVSELLLGLTLLYPVFLARRIYSRRPDYIIIVMGIQALLGALYHVSEAVLGLVFLIIGRIAYSLMLRSIPQCIIQLLTVMAFLSSGILIYSYVYYRPR